MKNAVKLIEIIKRPKTDGGKIHFGSYQREYCWAKKNYIEFVVTLENSITTKQSQPFGVIAHYSPQDENACTQMEIVDGQQRITTFSLFCAALYYKTKDVSLKRELKEILFSTDKNALVTFDYASSGDNDQNIIYEEIISNNNIIESKSNISKCYAFFKKYVKSYQYTDRDVWIGLKRIVVLEMECENKREALAGFRSINGYGVKVKPYENIAPIIENYISEYDGEEKEKELFKKYNFIHPYIYDDKNAVINYAYCVNKKTVTMKGIDSYVENLLSTHVNAVEDFLDSFKEWAIFQDNIENEIESRLSKSDCKRLHIDKDVMKSSFIHFISDIISPWKVIDYDITKDELFKIVHYYEICLIRQSYLRLLSGTSHTQKFDGVVQKCFEYSKRDNIPLSIAFKNMVEKNELSSEFPYVTDETIKSCVLNECAYTRDYTKSILVEINSYLTGGEDCFDKSLLTIEHIMPQSTENKYVHTLGNLTLLVGNFNSSASNKDFTEKKLTYSMSQIKLNRYFDDMYSWTEDDIKARGEYLADIICKNILTY